MKYLVWLFCVLVSFNWVFAQGSYLKPVSNEALFYKGLKVYSSQELYFRDTGIYIESSSDGQLDIVADGTVSISGAMSYNGAFQQSVSSASGYSYNLVSLTADTTSGTNLRGWRVNLTSGNNATGVGDMQCVHGYLTLGTTPTIAANAAIYPLSAWLDLPDGTTFSGGAVVAGIRAIFDANNNALGSAATGVESALFYGQTWASTGTIDAGIFLAAGAGTTIDAAFELGSGTFGSIMDFTSWGADNLLTLIVGGPKDAAALTHFHMYVGDSATRAAINSEVGATALGSVYINTTGEMFICTDVGTWQKVTTTASD